ncbi:alpha-amylase [Sesbania bispinosa]|nr:alpha-amylase [Sesbania bispinosa]
MESLRHLSHLWLTQAKEWDDLSYSLLVMKYNKNRDAKSSNLLAYLGGDRRTILKRPSSGCVGR